MMTRADGFIGAPMRGLAVAARGDSILRRRNRNKLCAARVIGPSLAANLR